jgi:hypothetical protein
MVNGCFLHARNVEFFAGLAAQAAFLALHRMREIILSY